MKPLILCLSLLTSLSSFACDSVDETITKFKIGFADKLEVVQAIDCNLSEATTPKSLCHTKVGLKKDQLSTTVKMFEVGMVAAGVVNEIKAELEQAQENCK